MSACDRLFSAGRMPPVPLAQPALMLQTEMDGASMAAIIAAFASVWRLRAACRRMHERLSGDHLFELLVKCLECPWLVR